MLHIGCHLSAAKGWANMGESALKIGADTFQFFVRNPRGSRARQVEETDAAALRAILQEHGFAPLLAHAPYTFNACSLKPDVRDFTEKAMREDLEALERHLPGSLYNFHPGSHVGQGADAGAELIAAMLNRVLRPEQTVTVLLETMSGKGSEVGGSFEDLGRIIQRVDRQDKIGVCLDTCHVHAAGYDIVRDLEGVLERFDQAVGLEKLRAVHLNDSMTPFASRKDRHAAIGAGSIGLEAVVAIITHPRLRRLPFYLETPHLLPGYAKEIALLRQCRQQALGAGATE